jgi:hypothetical protein
MLPLIAPAVLADPLHRMTSASHNSREARRTTLTGSGPDTPETRNSRREDGSPPSGSVYSSTTRWLGGSHETGVTASRVEQ